jgi:peptide/nickel transport system substrate-binding protein
MMISNNKASLGLLRKATKECKPKECKPWFANKASFGLLSKRALDISALVIIFLVGLLLTACGLSGTWRDEAVNQATVTIGNEQAQKEAAREGEAPTTNDSRVGGSLVIGVRDEPDTLDAHKTARSVASQIMSLIGASLVDLDPAGNVVPYLAERWETSADGLTWTFHLKQGITFHDGTPFTAQDYVYTIQRALNPETASPAAGALLGPVTAAKAVDDDTLVITLAKSFFPLLTNLTASGYLMPLSQAAVMAGEDTYGRQPISVGPYRFKEWRTGEYIVLERNPDFNWGPAFAQKGPYYLETIEFRFLPDPATTLAVLEAGGIDVSTIAGKDVAVIQETGQFEIYAAPLAGASPMGVFNVKRPPFDDRRVRQAFNLAVNRTPLIQAAQQGHAQVQHGPISPAVPGYWPGIEEISYNYDLVQAKALLVEAGYQPNALGALEKEGQPLAFPLLVSQFTTDAEVLSEQYQAIGADVSIEVMDSGSLFNRASTGDFQMMLISIEYPDADILYLLYHSHGSLPIGLADAELDQILDRTRSTIDPAQRQEWVNQAQARIVKQAYMLPLYAPTIYTAVNRRVKDIITRPDGSFIFSNAYIERE